MLAIKDLHLSDKSLDAEDVTVKYLTEEELKSFASIRDMLPHVRMKEFHDMFMLSFHACGLRLIDMMTLRWIDIDFKKQVIRKIQVKTRNRNLAIFKAKVQTSPADTYDKFDCGTNVKGTTLTIYATGEAAAAAMTRDSTYKLSKYSESLRTPEEP